jgi:hypothetical protein
MGTRGIDLDALRQAPLDDQLAEHAVRGGGSAYVAHAHKEYLYAFLCVHIYLILYR